VAANVAIVVARAVTGKFLAFSITIAFTHILNVLVEVFVLVVMTKIGVKFVARRFKTIFLVFFVAKRVLVVLVLAAIDRRDGDVERAVPAVVIGHELPRIEAQCKRQESRGWLEVWVAASGASMKEKCNSSVVGTDGSMIVRLDDQCEKTKAKADFSCRGGFPRCLRWNTARLVP
jgi:hypothetical protein